MYNNFFLILCGPTGTGKTDLSYELARRYPIEIINCDIGQFYEPLTIGTAKPAWKNHATEHHLFDVVSTPAYFSVMDYRERVKTLLQEIWARNALPVIVGGSMFYVRALFFPPINNNRIDLMTSTSKRELVNHVTSTPHDLWEKLFVIDPTRALSLHKNDLYRIKRALDLWYDSGGILPSQCKPVFESLARFYIIFVTRNREDLYCRIDDRVKRMVEAGWIEEVVSLSSSWKSFLMHKKILGYPEIITFLQESAADTKEKEFLIQDIQKKTRNYAKRQITFWRSLKRDILQHDAQHGIFEANLTVSSINEYLDNIQHIISKHCKGKNE